MATTTLIAMLRGINVGGKNRIPMAELRQMVEDLGFEDVATFIQSGNVVFSGAGDTADVERRIEHELEERLGLDVPVIVRSAKRWSSYASGNPFLADAEREPNHVLIGLSKAPPAEGAAAALRERAAAGELIEVVGDALWIHFVAGIARSKLTPAVLDRLVGSSVTTRNWRTVQQLAAMAQSACPHGLKAGGR